MRNAECGMRKGAGHECVPLACEFFLPQSHRVNRDAQRRGGWGLLRLQGFCGDGEFVFGELVVGFAGVEDGAGEVGVVGGVGGVLGFDGEAEVGGVGDAVFSFDAGEVSAVGEVDDGFGGEAFEESPGGGVVDFGGFHEGGVVFGAIEEEGVIVAGGLAGETVLDVASDGFGLGEVERGAGDGGEFAGGDEGGVHGKEAVGVEVCDVVEVFTGLVAAEVEVGVLGEVDGGGFVGGGEELDFEGVVVGEGVDDGDVEVAGEAFGAVGIEDGESDGGAVGGHAHVAFPVAFAEAFEAAVEAVGALVGGDGNIVLSCSMVKVALPMRLANRPTTQHMEGMESSYWLTVS